MSARWARVQEWREFRVVCEACPNGLDPTSNFAETRSAARAKLREHNASVVHKNWVAERRVAGVRPSPLAGVPQ